MNKTIGLGLGLIGQYFQLFKFILYKNIWRHVTFWVDVEVRDQKQEEAYAKVELIKEKYDHWEGRDTAELLLNNAIYIVIMTLILIVIIIEPKFLSIRVFRNIFTQSSVRLILALGVAGIIILQGTDLSLGRSVGFAAIITASLLQEFDYGNRFYESIPLLPEAWVWKDIVYEGGVAVDATMRGWFYFIPLLFAMMVSGFFSMINGFVVSVFKVHPFLATLGASVALYGILSMYFSSGDPGPQPIGGFVSGWEDLIIGELWGIPLLIIYAMIITIIMWVVWNKTTFGKNMYAVGGNPEAAKISGVNVVKTTVLVYIVAGFLYGLGGYLEVARIGSASNATGINYELDAIAACVVGGISFSGGIGKISGAVAGVLMFTIISYAMNFLGLDVFWQYIIKGVIIVLAVALDTRKYIKKT
jgi:methyl-galactoside transport system permease protein